MIALVAAALADDLLFTHAHLWDGTGAPVQTDVDVLVRDDRVAAVGAALTAAVGVRVIDATGATIVPGLIDSHVHLSMDPGAAWRPESPERHDTLLAWHLRAYLACGVTALLDPAVLPVESERIRSMLTRAPGPRYLSLGVPFSPPGGYVQVVLPELPSVATPAQVEAQLDVVVTQGAVGIKTTWERGMAGPVWPLYVPEVVEALRSGAAARGLPIYTHAIAPEEQRRALDRLGPRAFVHPPERYDARLTARVAAAGVYEMTTLSILDTMRIAWQPERLADPLVRLTVPPEELATAADPRVVADYQRAMVRTLYPGVPFPRLLARIGFGEGPIAARLARTARALRALRDAGAPIVMGSDAGNWPILPFEFHGPTSIREIELLGEAGFTPAEALTAATRTAAEMLGIEAGIVAPGRIADFVVVEGDPLADLSALRRLRYTVRAGVARSPEEWMAGT